MLLCFRCAGRVLSCWGAGAGAAPPRRLLSRDTSHEVPTTFSSDLEENKTSVNILNEDKSMVFFERFGRYGFKLSTGIFVLGPVLAFPKSVYSWQVAAPSDIGPQSLAALRVIFPRPDIFILGKGDPSVRLLLDPLTAYFRELRLNYEILPTEEALTTFNFLNSEGRYVSGAFLPPSMRDMYKEELDALEVANRRRRFQLPDTTGGTYGGEIAAPSIDALPPLPRPPTREDRGGAGDGATVVAGRAEAEGRRRRLEAARSRVESDVGAGGAEAKEGKGKS